MDSEFEDNDGLDDFDSGPHGSVKLKPDPEDDIPGFRHGELVPRFDAPIDLEGEFDSEEIVKFFELVSEAYGYYEIAISLAWSPYQLKRFLDDPERLAILDMLKERQHDQVERSLLQAARAGNPTAIRTWLFCQARHRGWSDTRKIEIQGQSRTEIVVSVAQGVRETIQAQIMEHGEDAVLALQSAYVDVEEGVIDAEVVDAD